jgi:hypothetical protein
VSETTRTALETRSWQSLRGELASHSRHHYSDADVTELRAALKVAKLEDRVRQLVEAAPPLTADQRSRLAQLLTGPTP